MFQEEKTTLTPTEKQTILELWNNEYPATISLENLEAFNQYLAPLKDQFHRLVKNEHGEVIAWYFDFMRDGERNFAMIVSRTLQGSGIGKSLLLKAQEHRTALFGWAVNTNTFVKTDGSPYHSPEGFYQKHGFQIHHDIAFKSEKLSTIKISWKRTEELH